MNEVVVGIACEDRGHVFVVTRLVDQMLISAHPWLDGIVADCRRWRGLRDGEPWYKYDPTDADDLRPIVIDGQTISPHGHIGGQPLEPEAGMWRRVLLLFGKQDPRPNVVILVRDMDGYADRRAGLVQVRDGLRWPFRIVVAAAQPEIEAWLVSGFVARDKEEQARFTTLKHELSFDPATQSHRLTSHPNDARTDAKRALHRLCGDGEERREACLLDRPRLRERGSLNGLSAFLDEVDQHIVPLFGRTP